MHTVYVVTCTSAHVCTLPLPKGYGTESEARQAADRLYEVSGLDSHIDKITVGGEMVVTERLAR